MHLPPELVAPILTSDLSEMSLGHPGDVGTIACGRLRLEALICCALHPLLVGGLEARQRVTLREALPVSVSTTPCGGAGRLHVGADWTCWARRPATKQSLRNTKDVTLQWGLRVKLRRPGVFILIGPAPVHCTTEFVTADDGIDLPSHLARKMSHNVRNT